MPRTKESTLPAPRAWLDGLDPAAAATGQHYADLLEQKILEEGPESVLAFILEPIGGASTGALVRSSRTRPARSYTRTRARKSLASTGIRLRSTPAIAVGCNAPWLTASNGAAAVSGFAAVFLRGGGVGTTVGLGPLLFSPDIRRVMRNAPGRR